MGVAPDPLVTLTLSSSVSMLMVAGETSVKVRVTALLLSAVNMSVSAVKAVPVPMPDCDITWLSRVLLPTTVTLMLCCAVVCQPVTPKSKRRVYTVLGVTEKVWLSTPFGVVLAPLNCTPFTPSVVGANEVV